MESEGLKDKTIKGVKWTAIEMLARYLVTFIVGIILARLLGPENYGLIGILSIFIALSSVIIDGGFSNALIQKKDANDDDYNTVFVTNILMSAFLYVVFFVLSGYIADFFNKPILSILTKVLFLNMIVGAFGTVQSVQLTKSLKFKTQTKISITSSVISSVIGIVTAYLGFGVWALVISSMSGTLITSTLLWINNKWIPKLKFSKDSFNNLFGFGWKLLVTGLIDTLWNNLYQIVIGKFYSAKALGQYSRATGFSNMVSVNLTSIIQKVSFPSLSLIQNETQRLQMAYKKMIKVSTFITFILMMILAAIAKPLIFCLIGEEWLEAAYFLQIICFSSMLYPLHAMNVNALKVMGRSDLILKLEIAKKCIAVIPIVFGILFSIYWMLYTSIATGIICYFLNSYYSGKLLDYGFLNQIRDIVPSLLIALAVGVLTFLVSLLPINIYVVLGIQLIFALSCTIVINELVKLPEYLELKNIIIPFTKSFISRCRI